MKRFNIYKDCIIRVIFKNQTRSKSFFMTVNYKKDLSNISYIRIPLQDDFTTYFWKRFKKEFKDKIECNKYEKVTFFMIDLEEYKSYKCYENKTCNLPF